MNDTALATLGKRAIARAGGTRFIPGNTARLLIDGPEAFPVMLDAIRGAQRWVHFENYIMRDDATGRRFAEALAERARAGVKVRVLCDWFGSIRFGRDMARELRAAGAELRFFNPPRLVDLLGNLARDHRKLVVSDAGAAIVGGLCIGDEWCGDPGQGLEPWRDTALEVRGPAMAIFESAFAEIWGRAGGAIPDEEAGIEWPVAGDAEVGVVIGAPRRSRIQRIVELLAAGAVERLWLTDAYLVAPRSLFQAILDAAQAGVDVRLLVPGASDLPAIRNLTRIGYRDLLRAGVRIFEWDGPMLHAKTIVADGEWCRVGSSNLNPSSLTGNYELDAIVHDRALASLLEGQFRKDAARSREVTDRSGHPPRAAKRRLPAAPDQRWTHLSPAGRARQFRVYRRRASLGLRGISTAARRSVFAPVALGLAILALLFLVLPRSTAVVVGALCGWLALGAGAAAFRDRGGR